MRRARNSGRKPDLIAMMGFHQERHSVNIPPFLLSATHTALPIIHRYGLWVISGALFLDSFGVIFVPGESILVAAGFLARYGALSIWLLIPMTVIAATLGNYGAYGLGSRFSHLNPAALGPMDWNYRAAKRLRLE